MDLVKVKEMIEIGFSATRIAVKLDILQLRELQAIIKENGWKMIKEDFDQTTEEKIVDLYEDGVSAKSLGIKYSIDKRRVQKWAKERDVLRVGNEARRFYALNYHRFDEVDTPEKAYWLGFFYGDGFNSETINAFVVGLKGADVEHLKKCARFMEFDERRVIRKIQNNGYDKTVITFHNQYLCERLSELGCPQAKSFLVTFPEWLDKSLRFHFIRGVYDADGGTSVTEKYGEWKAAIAGTEMLVSRIAEIYKSELDVHCYFENISKSCNNTSSIQTSGNVQILKLLERLYQDSAPEMRLDRKYELFLELKKIQSSNKFTSLRQFSSDVLVINNQVLTADFLGKLNEEDKLKLGQNVLDYFDANKPTINWTDFELKVAYERIIESDLSLSELDGLNPIGINICKHFCRSYFDELLKSWNNKKILAKAVNLSLKPDHRTKRFKDISEHLILQMLKAHCNKNLGDQFVKMLKPTVVKSIIKHFTKEDSVVGDFYACYGSVLLAAKSCGLKYIGCDKLTKQDLDKMIEFFKFENCYVLEEIAKFSENVFDIGWIDFDRMLKISSNHFSDLVSIKNQIKSEGMLFLDLTNNKYNQQILIDVEKVFGKSIQTLKIKKDLCGGVDDIHVYVNNK
jgi:hypothetical protein